MNECRVKDDENNVAHMTYSMKNLTDRANETINFPFLPYRLVHKLSHLSRWYPGTHRSSISLAVIPCARLVCCILTRDLVTRTHHHSIGLRLLAAVLSDER